MPQYQSAGVYVVEKDLSQVIASTSTSTGAIVLYASKGEINKTVLCTSVQDFLAKFGNPHPSRGFGAYAALAFLERSNQLYVTRVVSGSYAYAGIKAGVSSGTPTGTGSGQLVPENISLAATDAFYLYAIGPGAYANTLQLEIVSNNMVTPSGLSASTATSGGTLAASTYSYKVTAFNALGETAASTAVTQVTTGSTSTVTITIPRISNAVGYKVYGRVSGTERLMKVVSQPETGNATFTDDGSITPDTTKPVSGVVAYTATNEFTVKIYDTAISSSRPQEAFDVSLVEKLDGYGQQMEMETRINSFSKLVRVYLNPTYSGSANLYPMAVTSLSGGADGDAYSSVTDGTFTAGWDLYADTEAVTARLLIEGGRGSATVQLKMDSIAHKRGDCVAILDVPSYAQEASAAVEYRNIVLNLNSNRSTLYTPDLKVNDPYNDLVLYVPPSGYIASVYAYTDFVANAWWAPAGLNRGLLSVLGLRYKYNQGQRDLLAPAQVNYIRNMPGIGIAVWECYTLQAKQSAFSFVNVRRLFDFIAVSVKQALLYSEFEPNDDFLKRQVVNMIGTFLEGIKNARGLSDYQVVCDAANNGPAVSNLGQLNIDVYIQPILPVRVIQLQLIATKQGVTVSEVIAQGGV